MPPTPSNPVKISVVFGIVWAFMAAFIVSNVGKVSGYGNPGVFVSLLSGLLTGAGIGTGSYYLFKNINTSVAATNAAAGKGSGGAFTGDWDNIVTAGYYFNQGQEKEAQAIQGLTTAIGTLTNFVPSATTCVPGINAAQINACTQAGFSVRAATAPTTTPGTAPPTTTPPTTTPGTTPGTTPPTTTPGTTPPTTTPGTTPPTTTPGTTGTTFAPGSQSCSAANLTADQLLQCIFSGNAQSGVGITDYQLQQLSRESGIPIEQLRTALSAANQASLQAAWQAAGGPAARPVPPRNPPASAPAVSLPGTKSKITPKVAAAIAFPIGTIALLGLGFFLFNFLGAEATGPSKAVFWGSLMTVVLTSISALGLGLSPRVSPGQQVERRTATYALAAVALVSGILSVTIALKQKSSLFVPIPTIPNSLKTPNFMGIMAIVATLVPGIGLAIDKGVNGKKRAPAQQKKRDIAMGVLIAIGGFMLLSGAAYKTINARRAAVNNTTAPPPPTAPPVQQVAQP